jgi:tripartite-type tricarboxylate transporter receptor subunit TctC
MSVPGLGGAKTRLGGHRFLPLPWSAGVVGFVILLAVAAAVTGRSAWSQTARTIKIIVPLAPGGGSDILARLMADRIGHAQSPTIVVENRAGAGSVIGTEAVSRAAPDGNTLLINTPNLIIGPYVRKLNYDALKSFEPICHLVSSPALIVVNSASPYRVLADLINAARASPGVLTLASVGPATTLHIAAEKLRRTANFDMIYVPYGGSGPAVTALLGEHVTAVLAEYPAVAEQLKAGKLRAIATASRTRIDALPEVPTVAESGYKDYEVDLWWGVFAPAKTPKEAVSQLAEWFTAALQAPEIKTKLAAVGFYPAGVCGADFAAYLAKQSDEYGRVIREANIKAE